MSLQILHSSPSVFLSYRMKGGNKERVVLEHRLNSGGKKKKETRGAFLLCTEYRCMQAYLRVLCMSLSGDHPDCLALLQAPHVTTNSLTWRKTQSKTPTIRDRRLPPVTQLSQYHQDRHTSLFLWPE